MCVCVCVAGTIKLLNRKKNNLEIALKLVKSVGKLVLRVKNQSDRKWSQRYNFNNILVIWFLGHEIHIQLLFFFKKKKNMEKSKQ